MSALVIREDERGLATLTLNRPDKLNALNVPLFRELLAHVEAIERQEGSVGAVLVRGAGRCFSAGFDLGAIGEEVPFANFQSHVVRRLAALPQPVITAVHGHCYAGGLEIALAGDITLVSESAKMADRHAKWGITPVWGMSQRLPRRVGLAKAMELMTTCRVVTGREAAEIGLANVCYADDTFEADVSAFTTSVIENSWFTHRANKKLLLETEAMSLRDGLAHEVYYNGGRSSDMEARMSGFGSPAKSSENDGQEVN